MKGYETVIGIEVHVELSTKSKIFCGCSTKFGGKPNTRCCPICIGMPGALPVLNRKVVEYGVRIGLALNCDITKESSFDRKNYFYPDLPKAYQRSQLYFPIGRNGSIEIDIEDKRKTIGIHEIHMEEDAGKLIHDPIGDHTLVDYNRSGIPLIEIVSQPDMNSKEEAIAFLEKLRLILQYLGVSDCKMQEGSFRGDINLSVRKKGQKELGTRTEMKNMNSFKAIGRAIDYEANRQIELLESGKKIVQETRRWDDGKGLNESLRTKEDSKDYRYFPDPDLVTISVDESWIEELRKDQPELRDDKINRYKKDYNLPQYHAEVITSSKHLAKLFEETVKICNNPKEVSNWLMVETMRLVREKEMDIEEISFHPSNLAKLIDLIIRGKVNRTIGKEIFELIFNNNIDPHIYVKEHKLGMVDDKDLLLQVVMDVLKENPESVNDYKNGKDKALRHLMGQTMKKMKGKADPVLVSNLLKEKLSKK